MSDLETLRERARAFFRSIVLPAEERASGEPLGEAGIVELQAAAREAGLWQFDVPVEWGGQGWGLSGACVVAEEVERSPVVPFRQNEVFGPRGTPILYAANADQQERYLRPLLRGELRTCFAQTEPEAGTDPGGMRTNARRDGDVYILDGRKRYIGGAHLAQFAQVICVIGDPAVDPREKRFGCLLVDMSAPGVTIDGPIRTMMGDDPWEIRFEQVRVPSRDLVGQEGEGFALGQSWLTHGRIRNHGARCVGIAHRSLELMMTRATSRVTFGAPLSERQVVQSYVADSAMEIEAARLLVEKAAAAYDRGEDVRDLSYMVKLTCTEMAARVVDRAMQIHGAAGLTAEFPLEYFFRQLRSLRITEGASEVLRWRLGRNLFRKHAGALAADG